VPVEKDSQTPPAERKKIDLKPRSAPVVAEPGASDAYKGKLNPFAGALPRDENLFQKKKEEERKLRENEVPESPSAENNHGEKIVEKSPQEPRRSSPNRDSHDTRDSRDSRDSRDTRDAREARPPRGEFRDREDKGRPREGGFDRRPPNRSDPRDSRNSQDSKRGWEKGGRDQGRGKFPNKPKEFEKESNEIKNDNLFAALNDLEE